MATINYLTTIEFDAGARRVLPAELKRLKIERPLIVTDKGVRAAGLLDMVTAALGAVQFVVYDDTPSNPTEDAVDQATELYLSSGADGIVALGGGSAIDLAKAVALLATHPRPLQQYAAVEGGSAKITSAVAPLIAIPTTAGTGSEVGRGSVIVMKAGRKLGLLSPFLLPKLAICDPELTIGLPAGLTAATGMDAVAHCIETYLAPSINPPAEAIALDGLRRAVKHIERATRDGKDSEARWNMLMAATEGALAFQKGLGAVHALSHPLGAVPGLSLHHGTLNAILLPAVMRFNASVVGDKMQVLAQACGLPADGDAAAFIADLNVRLGLPQKLSQIGMQRDMLAPIAELALKDHCHLTNPRLPTREDYLQILEDSF
ncbi:iron-containing alcohol dehydrogenase [Herbaspirillum sp. RV1423]|uniref:iron-containing alcohol dehydrogenase n=1 Tax=Herbaspirillum sp. RV1423 TaxID=1443993 RepID=UPI0004B26240|nr:iron-containing alcohol dehydrogenase [Herbaspirillum sp. RV1423]